jgi:predicted ABC-type ATPase
MNLPILGRLKDGVKFDFCTLADNVEQTDEFFEWWWEEKAKDGEISRPEVIADEDPILQETAYKSIADLCGFREHFDKTLFKLTETGAIPVMNALTRDTFRSMIMRIVAHASTKLPGRPQIVFSGGGYGSGKTTVLNVLSEKQVLPVPMSNLIGADVFKQLIPEYNLIKAVGDGRASMTVQKECVKLASILGEHLIEAERSFVLDSSMSDWEQTMKRIDLAKKHNYEMTMVAVLTPVEVAIRQAMRRAKLSRRFPNPEALPNSHVSFVQVFRKYFEHFDEIFIFANMGSGGDSEVVAEKRDGKGLEILNPELFNLTQFMPLPA